MIEDDVITRLVELHDHIEAPVTLTELDVLRGRRRVRRNRGLFAGAAAAMVAVVLGATATIGGQGRARSDGLEPAVRPGIVEGDLPVWYDAKGLHRGDVVEQTPVKILQPEQIMGPGQIVGQKGALALVRSGALYLHPATGDVWFHPWGGDPRIVGHNSEAGPGGDPDGDTATWFDGSELVVYDTAAGREISRTRVGGGVLGGWGIGGDHYPAGNGFLQVAAERITWKDGAGMYSHDVRTGSTTEVEQPKGRYLLDVHDGVKVFVERSSSDLVVSVPGLVEERFAELETHLRLSVSGNYLLAVEGTETRHAAAIVDTRTGELWPVPKNRYPWIAWSYGDIALVDTEDVLLACDAARRACETLPAERPFLMPTN